MEGVQYEKGRASWRSNVNLNPRTHVAVYKEANTRMVAAASLPSSQSSSLMLNGVAANTRLAGAPQGTFKDDLTDRTSFPKS